MKLENANCLLCRRSREKDYFSNAVFWWCSTGPQMTPIDTMLQHLHSYLDLTLYFYLSLQSYRSLRTFAPCYSHKHIFKNSWRNGSVFYSIKPINYCQNFFMLQFRDMCSVHLKLVPQFINHVSDYYYFFNSIRFNSLCLLYSLKTRGFQWSISYFDLNWLISLWSDFTDFFVSLLDWFLCVFTLIDFFVMMNYVIAFFDIIHYATFLNAWIFSLYFG